MTASTLPIPARDDRPGEGGLARALAWGAPLAALLAGMAAQWLDFRALRLPLLLMVLLGVIATAAAISRGRAALPAFALAVATGVATWGGAQLVYTVLHAASGEPFGFDRLGGPQPVRALGLITAHALFLGVPTGIAAGTTLAALRRAGFSR